MKYHFKINSHYPRLIDWLRGFSIFSPKTELSWLFTISEEAWYPPDIIPPEDREDTNKIVGITDFFSRKRSVRLAWRPNEKENTFDIFCYYYLDGKPHNVFLGTTQGGAVNYLSMYKNGKWLEFTYYQRCVKFPSYPKFGYIHQPYHGGTAPSPRNYWIRLEKIK